ncbi:MAG: hypothetical protein Q9201_005918 [Fulgogasparrea decipioides]
MAPPRLVLIFVSILTLTSLLTIVSLTRAHPRRYAAADTAASTGQSNFRSLFSFRTPSALFPSSAIISLTDDNSTFFLARPADFGPGLPSDGLSGQLWVGSGFGDDNLGRGLATELEGELGCSDVPGWHDGRKHYQGDSPFEPSSYADFAAASNSNEKSDKREHSGSDSRQHHGQGRSTPSESDGTDDHLHHPLPASLIFNPQYPGRVADLEHDPSGRRSQHADIQSLQEGAEIARKLVLLSRGGCGFLEKVKWVQRRGGAGLIVGDNTRGGALVTMYARGDTSNVTIPALFTSRTTAHLLSSLIPPEGSDDDDVSADGSDTEHSRGPWNAKTDHAALSDDKPTFTPTGFVPRSTSTTPVRNPTARSNGKFTEQSQQNDDKGGWFRSLFGKKNKKREGTSEKGALEDSRRPPSSGRLTWVNEQWTESALKPSKDRKTHVHNVRQGNELRQDSNSNSDAHTTSGDGFEIGVHDWRDPDLVGAKAANTFVTSTLSTSTKLPLSTALNDPGSSGPENLKLLSAGSITPSSGEYQQPVKKVHSGEPSIPDDEDVEAQGWLARLLLGTGQEEIDNPRKKLLATHRSRKDTPVKSSENSVRGDHEGLWVTLTPTTMSTSPFFDTLLVLVVSPLITLTVVYSLLLIRSRIRRRRWRAPKSVVDRLPVRTYHTMSSSSTTSSSQLATPQTSSATSPLLQSHPRLVASRARPRSHTASSIGNAVTESLDKATAKASMKQQEMAAASVAKKRQYHGKQIECVVCLEEYVDGQSKVMSLPCGHEFHAECITPWLTTRRRTCPICKGDVVRSMTKSAGKPSDNSTQPPRSSTGEEEDVQVQAAETSNDSPTAAIPIPRDIDALERGDDMAATLVDDPAEPSSSRRGWRGLASFSLSAFSGEAAWRQAQADRNR